MTRLLMSFLLTAALIILSSPEAANAAKKDKKKEEAAETEQAPEEPTSWICAADVSYKWKRTPDLRMDHKGNKLPSINDNVPTEPVQVFFRRPEARGVVVEDLKKRLKHRLPEVKAEALTACTKDHENESLCILEKMKSIQSEYRTLDYISRKKLIETIQSDCSRGLGICLSSSASEISCLENKSPDFVKPAPKAQEDEDKGKKKKK